MAEDVGVTGPAVYRHFRNKQALLAAAISSGLDLVESALARTARGSLDDLIDEVAEAGLERPDLWVLLQRESRFLDAESGARVEEQFGRVTDGFVRRLRPERPAVPPDLARILVAAATAVLASPAVSRTELPRPVYRRELAEAALAVLRVDPVGVAGGARDDAGDGSDSGGAGGSGAGDEAVVGSGFGTGSTTGDGSGPGGAASRRTRIVDTAIELFFHRGYGAVTLDDIGAAVGMAGPSLYHHFETKSDILVSAFDRAIGQLTTDPRHGGDPAPPLEEQVAAYTRFCLRHRALVGVYVSELMNLPPTARDEVRAVIRRRVADWTAALRRADDRLDEPFALVRVHAALGAIHDLVRLGQLHTRPGIAAEIDAIARAVLLRGADAR